MKTAVVSKEAGAPLGKSKVKSQKWRVRKQTTDPLFPVTSHQSHSLPNQHC
ncbi:MAG: hypothetical protein ACKPEO_22575 [Sphaerospermopsis kisseleviana]|uniref:hypothetical protein n=1 Tax=Sphaerospermopsis sp. FACHB-1094 TaxID=2692861 RepID=UPI0016894BE3|nr:hypothetical protein [Sphaerospermopsis sp. FACHB-1094]MBD2133613.1 hypothetical protein [Sphaerospermopsis sp. FACHB-1094]